MLKPTPDKYRILTVKPHQAAKIWNGKKHWIVKRGKIDFEEDAAYLIYEGVPKRLITGSILVNEVYQCSPSEMWEIIKDNFASTKEQFFRYCGEPNKQEDTPRIITGLAITSHVKFETPLQVVTPEKIGTRHPQSPAHFTPQNIVKQMGNLEQYEYGVFAHGDLRGE